MDAQVLADEFGRSLAYISIVGMLVGTCMYLHLVYSSDWEWQYKIGRYVGTVGTTTAGFLLFDLMMLAGRQFVVALGG